MAPEDRPTEDAGAAQAAAAPVLFANRVEKTYPNGTQALAEVRLSIARGEFVSLLGPSGCGKSTLLRMFAGLEEPSAGHVRWWGEGALPWGEPGRGFAIVFQEATLMPWADVERNVRLPLELAGRAREAQAPLVDEALERVGLQGFRHALPHELSGGMQMRVAIARALVTRPNLLLMDEPFGALDEFTRNRLDADLRALWAGHDLSVVFVTHSIYEAVFLSTRVVVMGARPGRIVADFAIDGPEPRDEAFRVSPAFIGHCERISRALQAAHGGDAPEHAE